jgi:hypothetical protein
VGLSQGAGTPQLVSGAVTGVILDGLMVCAHGRTAHAHTSMSTSHTRTAATLTGTASAPVSGPTDLGVQSASR